MFQCPVLPELLAMSEDSAQLNSLLKDANLPDHQEVKSLMLRILGIARVNTMQCWPASRRSDFEVDEDLKKDCDDETCGDLISRMVRW